MPGVIAAVGAAGAAGMFLAAAAAVAGPSAAPAVTPQVSDTTAAFNGWRAWPVRRADEVDQAEREGRAALEQQQRPAPGALRTLLVQRLQGFDVVVAAAPSPDAKVHAALRPSGGTWTTCSGRSRLAAEALVIAVDANVQGRRKLIVVSDPTATSFRTALIGQPHSFPSGRVRLSHGAGVFDVSRRVSSPVTVMNGPTEATGDIACTLNA
jgi:hypothetical protein